MDINFATDSMINVPARENDGYEQLLKSIRDKFASIVDAETKTPVFTTTTTADLYQLIIDAIPEDARQHYNCNACRGFVNRYGGLVVINPETGEQSPVMWDPDAAPEFFRKAVQTIYHTVKRARVSGEFLTVWRNLGTPVTGPYKHMSVHTPAHLIHENCRWAPINGVLAESSTNRKLLHQALAKYPVDVIGAVLNLIKSGQIAGGAIVQNNAEWFYDVAKKYKTPGLNLHNYVWYMAVTAPKGWCHINSNLFGTILEDVMSGTDLETVKRKYETKAAPDKYQRPQVAPSSGAIAVAEKKFADLGLENSLKRRYATLDEVQKIWTPVQPQIPEKKAGIFADLTPKNNSPKYAVPDGSNLPPVRITWEKFRATVIDSGSAKRITFNIMPGRLYPFAAVLTAADMDAPPIVLWDKEDARNPFTWYIYADGNQPEEWNIPASIFTTNNIPVTAIIETPNMWSNFMRNPSDKGIIMILEDCKDRRAMEGNSQLGLFATNVRKDLYDVRSVIEAYNKTHQASGIEDSNVSGILFQASTALSDYMIITVETELGRTKYVIDRWD